MFHGCSAIKYKLSTSIAWVLDFFVFACYIDSMGIYAEYLDRQMTFPELMAERKSQLQKISELRNGRDILVYASGFNNPTAPQQLISIINQDFLAFNDQLSNLQGKELDLVLETPGGSGEVAEQMVRQVRRRYDNVAVLVPGTAKSAGTIMAMSADEIVMGPSSALGPIDAQMTYQGKVFSADAFLKGLEKIKEEVINKNKLNLAYVPILQQISPGEIQNAQNALDFARQVVREWLVKYKFRNWNKHTSTNQLVTEEERDQRALEIANALCNQDRWKRHGKSLMIEDLVSLRLMITDYSQQPDLADAINRYYVLLQMTFESTNVYKVFETPTSQIYRFQLVQAPIQERPQDQAVIAEVKCPKCGVVNSVQVNFGGNQPLKPGAVEFPANNKIPCHKCGDEIDLRGIRRQIETQFGRPISS